MVKKKDCLDDVTVDNTAPSVVVMAENVADAILDVCWLLPRLQKLPDLPCTHIPEREVP